MKASFSVNLLLIISLIVVAVTGNELQDVQIDCGPVENLRIIESDFAIGATWDPPLGVNCSDDLFHVSLKANGVIKFFHRNFRNRYIEFDKESCTTYQFGVQAIQSIWVFETQISGIAGSGDVQNLQLRNETLSWTAPKNSDNCNISYIVNIDPEGFESTEKTLSTTKTEIILIPCGNYLISVTPYLPQSTNWTGNPVTISERGPINKLPPLHGSTWPNRTGALVNWIEQVEENACKINGIEFGYVLTRLKDTEEPYVQVFEISTNSWYQLDGMKENEEYSYNARWNLTEFEGDNINFLTKQLTPPIIEPINSEVTSDGYSLRIQWTQQYPDQFITKHIITVNDTGCIVPKSCENDEELFLWTFENEPNNKTVTVSPVFVNHRYNIEVHTLFGPLNAYTTNSTNFDFEKDNEGPGRIIEISGTKVINWNMRLSVSNSEKIDNLIEQVSRDH